MKGVRDGRIRVRKKRGGGKENRRGETGIEEKR